MKNVQIHKIRLYRALFCLVFGLGSIACNDDDTSGEEGIIQDGGKTTDSTKTTDAERDAGDSPVDASSESEALTIRWWGHSCFSVTSMNGVVLLTDPYPSTFAYAMPMAEPDICLISHEHSDHNAVDNILGDPIVVRERGQLEILGIPIIGVKTFHDKDEGATVGENTVYVWEMAQIRFAHLGDLAHLLTAEQLAEIGPVDVLMTPVGGGRSLTGQEAVSVAEQLKPKIVFPMHYKTAAQRFIGTEVDVFLSAIPDTWTVEKTQETDLTLRKSDLTNSEIRAIVLPYE